MSFGGSISNAFTTSLPGGPPSSLGNAPQNTAKPLSGVFLYNFNRCTTFDKESTTCVLVRSDFMLSAVPCSSFKIVITSCNCFPLGI